LYGELNLRRPLPQGVAGIAHLGLPSTIGAQPRPCVQTRGATRADLRISASMPPVPGSEVQLAAGSRGAITWIDSGRRRTLVLGVTTAF
jgi:hypothetical protein